MLRTKVLNLYGGAGCGKSTTAAAVFASLKNKGVSAELVTEYAKGWAWQERKIHPLDQYYLFGKQLQRESCLYGKVDVIVTDSPIGVSAYYAQRYTAPEIAESIRACHQAVRAQNLVDNFDVYLKRTKAYNPKGRYETEEQAREVDVQMRVFLKDKLGIECLDYGTENIEALVSLVFDNAFACLVKDTV